MAGLPPGVVARAREVAAVLSEQPALETRVPLRESLGRPGQAETQLSLEL